MGGHPHTELCMWRTSTRKLSVRGTGGRGRLNDGLDITSQEIDGAPLRWVAIGGRRRALPNTQEASVAQVLRRWRDRIRVQEAREKVLEAAAPCDSLGFAGRLALRIGVKRQA
eukprot:scaffold279011_cov28-Tisochrysis_lutea.AAC.2